MVCGKRGLRAKGKVGGVTNGLRKLAEKRLRKLGKIVSQSTIEKEIQWMRFEEKNQLKLFNYE